MSLCHPCAWSTVRVMFHMSSKFDVSLTNCHRGLTVGSEGRDKFTNVGRVFDACSSHQNMVGCFGCGKITQWMHCNRGPAMTPIRRGWWQEEGVEKKANTSATDGEIICVLIRVVNLSLPIVSHQIAT